MTLMKLVKNFLSEQFEFGGLVNMLPRRLLIRLIAVFPLVGLVALLDLVSIGVVVPFFSIMLDSGSIFQNPK